MNKADIEEWIARPNHALNRMTISEFKELCELALRNLKAGFSVPQGEPVVVPDLQDIEQYRMQMAGISTAALGYWKEGESIHPDYDTLALRDVAKLYAKYNELYQAKHAAPPDGVVVPKDAWLLQQARLSLDPFEYPELCKSIDAHLKGGK
jgi:hypothetical protein